MEYSSRCNTCGNGTCPTCGHCETEHGEDPVFPCPGTDPDMDGLPTHVSPMMAAARVEIKRLREELESVDCEHRAKVFSDRGKEIERLREKRLQELHQFLDEAYPQLRESGWLQRESERRTIRDFLVHFEAAEKAKET